MTQSPSVLLTSVFGPYGVDDAYGRKENVMELFHNQVTREQGLFSLRYNHPSFGLYFMAENVSAPATVLDFPSEARFVRELRRGYDYVGISFIVPNFAKARRMAELVREHAPDSQIVLGGHGTRIPGLARMIEHDHICKGEGVQWLRRLLGEDADAPYRHPAMPSGFAKRILGVPVRTDAAVLVPGVGCPNACRFCATSHFFDRTYTPFFDTGQALYDVCDAIEQRTGAQEFFVMDENFLKRPERARDLVRLMEEHGKLWRFGLFSSAETVTALGAEFLARLGVYFLWVGVESAHEVYDKNKGIDLRGMVRDLRDHGISVLASGILFLEHHDEDTLQDDVRYLCGLESDFVQFMQLGPLPGTELYREYRREGRLLGDVPYEEWHGQHRLWFDHPSFSGERSEVLLREAFQYDYDTQGPSILRMCETAVRGYQTLARYPDAFMARRREYLRGWAQHLRPLLPVIRSHAHNDRAREVADSVIALFDEALGPMTQRQRAFVRVVRLLAAREAARVAAGRAGYQPRTSCTRYRTPTALPVVAAARRAGGHLLRLLWGPAGAESA